MNTGLNNDEKNWLLTLYSNLKQNERGGKISTIFTPKQIIEYCYGITKYLALSPLSESRETLSERLQSLWEETGFMVRNIWHGADQGDITSGYYEDDNNYLEYFKVDIINSLTGSFALLSSDGLDDLCSADFGGGGFFTDSWGDYDVMPMNDFYIEPSSYESVEVFEMVVNYVKNHFVILAPKTLKQINREVMKFGFVDDSGSYSIYNGQVISISDSITGKMIFGEFPINPEPLSFYVRDDTVIVGYDKTIPIPSESSSDPDEEEINEQQEPGAEPIEPTPIEIVNGRINHAQNQASLYLLKLMRGDFSDFDVLDDIKIQLPEEQADILLNFRNYIN